MFNVLLTIVVSLSGQPVASYERNVVTNFDTIAECKIFLKQVMTSFKDEGDFVYTVSGLCGDKRMVEAADAVKERAARVGDKAAELLTNYKRNYDAQKLEEATKKRQQPTPPSNYQRPNYQLDKQM